MNLAEFPFGILKRQGDGDDPYVYEGTITTKDGQRHQQRWEVHGLGSLGLLSEYDERVLIALMAITAGHTFQNRKVPFSVYQILQIMGVGTGKRDYQSVERALKRLIGVTIFAEGAFWDHGDHQWVSKTTSGFHILEKYWLAYQEKNNAIRDQEGVPAYIIWICTHVGPGTFYGIVIGGVVREEKDQPYPIHHPPPSGRPVCRGGHLSNYNKTPSATFPPRNR